MSSFLSQLPYILAAAAVIAILAAVWAFVSLHNERERNKAEVSKIISACSGCSMAGICMSRKTGEHDGMNTDRDTVPECGKSGQA